MENIQRDTYKKIDSKDPDTKNMEAAISDSEKPDVENLEGDTLDTEKDGTTNPTKEANTCWANYYNKWRPSVDKTQDIIYLFFWPGDILGCILFICDIADSLVSKWSIGTLLLCAAIIFYVIIRLIMGGATFEILRTKTRFFIFLILVYISIISLVHHNKHILTPREIQDNIIIVSLYLFVFTLEIQLYYIYIPLFSYILMPVLGFIGLVLRKCYQCCYQAFDPCCSAINIIFK